MKRFNCLFIPFMSAFVFALCSCQSEKGISGPARVRDVALKASLSGAESRTTMTDTYGGAFTETWNKDVLSIYHSYRSNGTAQSLLSLDFATTATGTSSAIFSYSGSSDYTYNPAQPLYAFNKLTGTGQSTPSLTGTSDTPISLSFTNWTAQDGTLTGSQNVAFYDAMVGYGNIDTTGAPTGLRMKHLGGILNFHLICNDFTDGAAISNVAFTTKGSDPMNPPGFFSTSGTASIASDGACTFTATPTLVSTWSPSGNFISTGKAIDVYFSSFPIPPITNGTLMIYASDANNSYGGSVPNNFSLSAGNVNSVAFTLTKIPTFTVTSDTYSKLYAWDAIDNQPVVINTAPKNANTTATATDYLNHASYACKNCPNYNEISWYLKGGCYWDDGMRHTSGGNGTSYKTAALKGVKTTLCGMWFLKKCFINGFSSTAPSDVVTCTPTKLSGMTAAQISALNLSKYYFFLPAAGFSSYSDGIFNGVGSFGDYWSSTPGSDSSYVYRIDFSSEIATIAKNFGRTFGSSLWQGQ